MCGWDGLNYLRTDSSKTIVPAYVVTTVDRRMLECWYTGIERVVSIRNHDPSLIDDEEQSILIQRIRNTPLTLKWFRGDLYNANIKILQTIQPKGRKREEEEG